MVESTFHIKKLVGVLLIAFGLLGFSYLGWTYVVWGATLPTFSDTSVFDTANSKVQGPENGGFASLLSEKDSKKTVDGSATTPTEIAKNPSTSDGEDSFLDIKRDRVLGESTTGTKPAGGVYLDLPRLGIQNAKVELDVDGTSERIYDTVLTRALAHLQKSAYPGQYGNTFIFGHSKLPIWAGSDYESIFTNLPKVKVGDVVYIRVDGTRYEYQVMQTGVVSPSDVFITNQPASKKMLTLMTCIPPGFANNRYITVAELIDVQKVY